MTTTPARPRSPMVTAELMTAALACLAMLAGAFAERTRDTYDTPVNAVVAVVVLFAAPGVGLAAAVAAAVTLARRHAAAAVPALLLGLVPVAFFVLLLLHSGSNDILFGWRWFYEGD